MSEDKNSPHVIFDGTSKRLLVDENHPAVKELRAKWMTSKEERTEAGKKVLEKLKSSAADSEAGKAYAAHLKATQGLEADRIKASLTEVARNHAAEEHRAYEAAAEKLKTAEHEFKTAEHKVIGAIKDPAKEVKGFAETHKDDIQKLINESKTHAKATGKFGILRSGKEAGGGFVAALKRNFREASGGKIAMNVLGTGAGVVLIGDGLFRGEKTADDGKPVDRGFFIRAGEVVGGTALVAASALRGGRAL